MATSIDQVRELFQRGEFEKAKSRGEEIMLDAPPTADLLDLMGLIHARLGRFDSADQFISKAMEAAPENPELISHRADICAMNGDFKSSVKHYRRALTLCTPKKTIGQSFAFSNLSFRGDEFSYLNPSFSVAGEDLILRKLLKDKLRSGISGFYVDIGAGSTVLGSNTYLFYCYGWRGICIDANPATKEAFHTARPRDAYFNCSVGPKTQDAFFARHKSENTGMSKVAMEADAFGSEFMEPIKIQSRRLCDIIDEVAPSGVSIDLMSIDVEGGEFGVISSNDWDRHRPRIIVMEHTTFNSDDLKDSRAIQTLLECNYSIIGWIAPNVYLECGA